MSPEARSRWTDDRLDDLSRRVDNLNGILERLTALEGRLGNAADDARECLTQMRQFKADLEADKKVARDRAEERRREHRRDRQWFVGVVIAASAVIVAATGLLLGLLP